MVNFQGIGVSLQSRSTDQAKMQVFTASIWREEDGFVAQRLEVDIASQGAKKEALTNLGGALELYFEPLQPKRRVFPI